MSTTGSEELLKDYPKKSKKLTEIPKYEPEKVKSKFKWNPFKYREGQKYKKKRK